MYSFLIVKGRKELGMIYNRKLGDRSIRRENQEMLLRKKMYTTDQKQPMYDLMKAHVQELGKRGQELD